MIIQGHFPNGIARVAGPAPQTSRPQWVNERIGARAQAVQPRMNGNATPLPPNLTNFVRTGGDPLPAAVRQKMESCFGTSFGDVRVHVGRHVAAIGATAFTTGSHLHFAPGQYNPATHSGQRLIAHELAHVVQQRTGRVRNPLGSRDVVVQDPLLEAEAERFANRAAATFTVVQRSSEGLGFGDKKKPTGYGSVSLEATLGGFDLGMAWSQKTTYSKGSEHAEDALCDLCEAIEWEAERQNKDFKKDLVVKNLTASPCSSTYGTCTKGDMDGCAERLIELAGRGFVITIYADHYYQPKNVEDAKKKSIKAVKMMIDKNIKVLVKNE